MFDAGSSRHQGRQHRCDRLRPHQWRSIAPRCRSSRCRRPISISSPSLPEPMTTPSADKPSSCSWRRRMGRRCRTVDGTVHLTALKLGNGLGTDPRKALRDWFAGGGTLQIDQMSVTIGAVSIDASGTLTAIERRAPVGQADDAIHRPRSAARHRRQDPARSSERCRERGEGARRRDDTCRNGQGRGPSDGHRHPQRAGRGRHLPRRHDPADQVLTFCLALVLVSSREGRRPKSGTAVSWPAAMMPRRMARVRVKSLNSVSPSSQRMAR